MANGVVRIEFGDFQTPIDLAREVCTVISRTGFRPACILEPTCGVGAFIRASLEAFPNADRAIGFDRNAHHAEVARNNTRLEDRHDKAEIKIGDFFEVDWTRVVGELPQPLLIVGNPPWVTNAALGSIRGSNSPRKSNVDNLRGIDALTGKSNFDISEWMLRENLRWLDGKNAMLAVLCKTAVARKALAFAWTESMQLDSASIYQIDAKKHFNVSVDACLLLISMSEGGAARECRVFASLSSRNSSSTFGIRLGGLVADVNRRDKWDHLWSGATRGWRSGIKHDLAKVFELRKVEKDRFVNGLNEFVQLESGVVFPLLKSSDLASHRGHRKWLLVPQRSPNDPPSRLQTTAPNAWKYLIRHSDAIEQRRSSIYRGRPPFSVFGIGEYSFSQWKVAISGLYKKLDFVVVQPVATKPVMVDDTCYFFPCDSEQEADQLSNILSSQPAREFFSAHIFWDAKRPITAKHLNSLDLGALSKELGLANDTVNSLIAKQQFCRPTDERQQCLF